MAAPDVDDDAVQPRSSIEKAPVVRPRDDAPSAFERLPDEIITQYVAAVACYFCSPLLISLLSYVCSC